MHARRKVSALMAFGKFFMPSGVGDGIPRQNDGRNARRTDALPFLGEGIPLARKVRVNVDHLIFAPLSMLFSGERRERLPSLSSAQRIMPSDLTPQSLTGFKLVTSTTFFPTISSGV